MPTDLFYALDTDKQSKIVAAAVFEFAKYGYTNSSTNRIVKGCSISKGSLFKYFQSKEELYFYILDRVTAELMSSLEEKTADLPKELFKRVIQYSEFGFAWYIQNPDQYKLILKAFTKSDTPMYQKIAARYRLAGQEIYYKLLEDIDTQSLKWGKQKTIDILKWFLNGFNQDFMERTQAQNHSEIGSLRNEYVSSLTEYMEALKSGLMR